MKRTKRYTILTLFLCMMALSQSVIWAGVRVGIYQYPGYAVKDEEGNLSGSDVEFAYRIAQTADMDIEIVLLDDNTDFFGSLDNGNVDMLFDILKTPERETNYLFSEHEIGSTPFSVYVANDDDRFSYGKTEQLKTLTYGFDATSLIGQLFTKWCEKRGFTPAIKGYQGNDLVDAAILSKEVDAGLVGANDRKGFRTIARFSPQPYYIIFRKADIGLRARVDDAMEQILAADPLYESQLITKYNDKASQEMDALTQEEKQYLTEHPKLTVAVLDHDEPYYSRTATGSPRGVIPDYFKRISAITGTQFVFSPYGNQQEAVQATRDGQADILGIYSAGFITAYNLNLRITRPFAEVEMVMISPLGMTGQDIKKIAIKKRSQQIVKQASIGTSNTQFQLYDNAFDCFQAMKKKQVDAIIVGLPSATWLINQTNSSTFNLSPVSSTNITLNFAVDKNNTVLYSIMDKAIRATSYAIDGIITNNTLQEQDLKSVLSRIPPKSVAIFACVMAAMVIGLVVSLMLLVKRQKEKNIMMTKMAETDKQMLRIEAMERNTEDKNRFFSMISHDMRTPLNGIIGFTDLAIGAQDIPSIKAYLEKIRISGSLLLDIINDTLLISKIESGKMTIDKEVVPSGRILNDVIVPIQEAAEKKRVTFIVDTKGIPDCPILTDRVKIQKIFLNLLSNAVKFTSEGGKVEFIAELLENTTYGTNFRAIIRDTGCGISDDFIEHKLYQPFNQEHAGEANPPGTGLGLSIVKQLVTLLGGHVSVKSEVGKGTEFQVFLRFTKASDFTPNHQGSPIADDDSLKGKRVLLCEDNALNAEIARAVLEKKDMHVLWAPNGKEGVGRYRENPDGFDVILMDLRMPVMDGIEATKAIRAIDQHIPIIAMTADAFEEDVKRCADAGMNAHVAKPINPPLLYATICMCITHKSVEVS